MPTQTSQFCDQVLPQIGQIQPYIPGKPIDELQRELGLNKISKLASNENPLGASHKVVAAVQHQFKEIARYPDGSCFHLKQALSEFLQLPSNQIAIGNGSNELLELVARVFCGPGDEVIYSQYAFAVYPISAQVVGATGVEVPANDWGHDLNAMAAAITDKTKLIYIANPNNPTGTVFDQSEWEAFISKVPSHVVVVLDEAYLEYARETAHYPDGQAYIDDYANLLVCRTFSKAYGLASLRIGYMLGQPELIGYVNQIREPFNVNHFAQVGAVAALKDQAFVKQAVQLNKAGLTQIMSALDAMNIEYIPSSGNFICVHLGHETEAINSRLLQEGVILRPLSNYKMPNTLRVSIGTQQENQHFLDALSKVLNK